MDPPNSPAKPNHAAGAKRPSLPKLISYLFCELGCPSGRRRSNTQPIHWSWSNTTYICSFSQKQKNYNSYNISVHISLIMSFDANNNLHYCEKRRRWCTWTADRYGAWAAAWGTSYGWEQQVRALHACPRAQTNYFVPIPSTLLIYWVQKLTVHFVSPAGHHAFIDSKRVSMITQHVRNR